MRLIISVLTVLVVISSSMFAQSGIRFLDNDYFTVVDSTGPFKFGENTEVGGTAMQELFFDVYEGSGDTMSKRPMIVVAYGGSFISGNRHTGSVVALCESFAKMGYVAVALDYRVGVFATDQENTTLAVMRAMHDMKALVRYFKKDAATTNTFKIDTNRIIVGGISAGAITGVQTAYFDEESEIPDYIDTAKISFVGGIDGKSGNPGYSSKVAAVYSFSGAVGDTLWINPGDVPCISFHDIGDDIVPYDTREILIGAILPTGLVASGSRDVHARMNHINVTNEIWVYPTNDHVGYLNTEYQINVDRVRDFMYTNVINKFGTSVSNIESLNADIYFYPNPVSNKLTIVNNELKQVGISLYNILGQKALTLNNVNTGTTSINVSELKRGIYWINFVDAQTSKLLSTSKVIIN